ncbi:MAG: cupin domain-containing protein [Casimicrobiaceae bacterium]
MKHSARALHKPAPDDHCGKGKTVTTAQKVDWDTMAWDSVREGVERKLCIGEQATLALHRVSASASTVAHAHPQEQFVYVLGGRVKYDVGHDTHFLNAGDVLVVPPNVVHRSETVSAEPAVTLDVFAPKRDY